MSQRDQFYNEYYDRNKVIGPGVPALKDRIIIEELCSRKTRWGNVLDIGCLNSPFMQGFRRRVSCQSYYGLDLIPDEEGQAVLSDGIYKCVNIDEGIPDFGVSFDLVVCSEVIEHLFSPDNVFRYAAKALTSDGILVITTPNLGVWYNRLLLLAGYQPCFTEVSDQYNDLGKIKTDSLKVGGHLRVFTLKALLAMGDRYNFKVLKICAANDPLNWLGRVTHWAGCLRPSWGRTLICFFQPRT